ncbi:MAG: VOC family protein [Candidatus Kapaibacterium sp.]
MAIRYVGALIIEALEPETLAKWYSHYFDFEISLEHDGGLFGAFETERGPFHFGLTPYDSDPNIGRPRGVIITFRVDNFDSLLKKLKKDGYEPIAFAEDDDGKYAMFRDPEGNQVSVWGE